MLPSLHRAANLCRCRTKHLQAALAHEEEEKEVVEVGA